MRVLVALFAAAVLVSACSEEGSRPIDLSSSGASSSTVPGAGPGPAEPGGSQGALPPTPHAIGESPQARAHAEQQCQRDPMLEQGVIRIVDPSTQRVVGEVIVDCAEVRAASPG